MRKSLMFFKIRESQECNSSKLSTTLFFFVIYYGIGERSLRNRVTEASFKIICMNLKQPTFLFSMVCQIEYRGVNPKRWYSRRHKQDPHCLGLKRREIEERLPVIRLISVFHLPLDLILVLEVQNCPSLRMVQGSWPVECPQNKGHEDNSCDCL